MPGFHGLTAKKTNGLEIPLTPKLYAQTTTTVSFQGSYSGFCPSLNTPSGAASLLYGSGTLDALTCGTTSFVGNPDNALAAAANAGRRSIGDWTRQLGPLVAYAIRQLQPCVSSSTARVKPWTLVSPWRWTQTQSVARAPQLFRSWTVTLSRLLL